MGMNIESGKWYLVNGKRMYCKGCWAEEETITFLGSNTQTNKATWLFSPDKSQGIGNWCIVSEDEIQEIKYEIDMERWE